MLFKDTLKRLTPEVDAAMDELFLAAKKNQRYEQDLLLVEINGFYDAKVDAGKSKHNFSPFVFGPGGWMYFMDYMQYRFYDVYRHQIEKKPRAKYFVDFKTNLGKQSIYDFTLQLELMVYL